MIGESSQFNTQESASSKSEQSEQDLMRFIGEQNYSANDVEQAFLIANGDENVENKNVMKLAEKMKELLDNGMPLNKLGEIIAGVKELETELVSVVKDYVKKLYSCRFDDESMKILQQLPDMDKGGTCVIKVNGQPQYSFEILGDNGPQEIRNTVLQVLDKLGNAGKQFPLQAEFHKAR
ncbi:MAG: hypothetical protein ACKUBY_04105 [Candidatus Moraniibacteriota bacterium]|jgi:hypothetical protein